MNLISLDPKHPGIHDPVYIQRRTNFYHLAREHRLTHRAASLVEYVQSEHAIWSHIYQKLEESHEKRACKIYLEGKKKLRLDGAALPQLKQLSERLQKQHQVALVPAEGLLDAREFFGYLADRIMPCTQFLRHGSDPEYTPEPDIVHDVLGHLPPLMDEEYAALMQLLGQASKKASPELMRHLEQIYWFAIEFGLIEEEGELKVFGAGLLSSYGEMEFCYSDQVSIKPFSIEDVINTPYDTTQMQKILFYISSFQELKKDIKKLIGG